MPEEDDEDAVADAVGEELEAVPAPLREVGGAVRVDLGDRCGTPDMTARRSRRAHGLALGPARGTPQREISR
ncbi:MULTISPECIES: hypothetical protein [unclassified Streptomyces]|uniref:hypothetical protein n=1 Tax=unclassified Streptomyces TaxID=2593676 RepID=UPI00190DCF93|nr:MULTISPECIES: hypothetical protein [unclassified Streptomyces]MBK3569655.1 hypothetical protein [Streptomyces sp. MBT62]MBK6016272.1 hypothetical protein [Streptomyces sp. MBT53]